MMTVSEPVGSNSRIMRFAPVRVTVALCRVVMMNFENYRRMIGVVGFSFL